jgi:hypothetical protein
MPGLYDKQLRAANRVFLNFEHQQGVAGIVGHGIELESRVTATTRRSVCTRTGRRQGAELVTRGRPPRAPRSSRTG